VGELKNVRDEEGLRSAQVSLDRTRWTRAVIDLLDVRPPPRALPSLQCVLDTSDYRMTFLLV